MLLSTIHRIKGREWDHVIIFDASRGLFPHRLGNDEEGERRVFHVALTRARTQVVALADADAPSIFLAELDGTRVRPSPAVRRGLPARRTGRGGTHRRPDGRTAPRRDAAKAQVARSVFAEVRLPTVEAVPGLVVEDRGNIGTVVELTDEAADPLERGRSGSRWRSGRTCGSTGRASPWSARASGRSGRRGRPRPRRRCGLEVGHGQPGCGAGLRHLEGCRADRHRRPDPATLAELAACRGIGQIRLERWGDEILAVLETARRRR